MRFSISKDVFEHFNELSIGVIIAEDIDNSGSSDEINKLVSEMADFVSTNFNPTEFANNQLISPWKSAYFDFEKKPYNTHSSVERLTAEIMKEGDIKRRNKLKDLCSFISLKHTVPVECFDLENIQGDFSLKRAKGNEHFYDTKAGKMIHPEKGEFIYMDSINVLSRKLDYKESDKAQVSKRTKRAIILIEGLQPLLKTKVEGITKEMAELTKTFCKGRVNFLVLDKNNSSAGF